MAHLQALLQRPMIAGALLQQPQQVVAIAAFPQRQRQLLELLSVDPALAPLERADGVAIPAEPSG